MNPNNTIIRSGITRQDEEQYFQNTLAVVRKNVKNYAAQVREMEEDIDEMLEHYHDNDVEVLTLLNNTITLRDHVQRSLARNIKAENKPYFGRIIFQDEASGKEESLYIGRGGISQDALHALVTDWRAPVASAYYENGLGRCSYSAPDGEIQIDLKLKRTYEIESGKLLDYFDSEVIANDDLLTKYLSKNKQAVLGEIVATIQKEQNEIIRKSPYHNIIVQGVAGSGKTTVAMHRISYILYNYAERFKPADFYIVGSNRILLEYITGVLPDLDVYGIRQMTMEQLFTRLLYEDWDDKRYRIRKSDKNQKQGNVRGGSGWFRDLKTYCDRLERKTISRESIFLNPKQFAEGVEDGKNGVFDRTEGKPARPEELILLVDGRSVEAYIRANPAISIQNKINMLNERLRVGITNEFLSSNGRHYTEAERKAILKAYRGRYGGRIWKHSVFDLYRDFLISQRNNGYDIDIPDTDFDVYDLAALAYLYKRIKETEVISEAHHIVIDEAQDFGMMAYSVLKFCIKDCTYTIMGDVSQNIHFGYGLNDWEELKQLFLTDKMDSFGILKKSYRNTVEISDFAARILEHGTYSVYPAEPIIRHGEPVKLRQCEKKLLLPEAAEQLKSWQEKGYDTIAVVCRDQEAADRTATELGRYAEILESNLEKAVFESGILVLPVEYTKGLEFDAVLILDPDRTNYPTDNGHAKLLYVAATRALHELCVLHTGNLTGLIADPLPEKETATQNAQIQADIQNEQRAKTPNIIQNHAQNQLQGPVPNEARGKVRTGLQYIRNSSLQKNPESTEEQSFDPLLKRKEIRQNNKRNPVQKEQLTPQTPLPAPARKLSGTARPYKYKTSVRMITNQPQVPSGCPQEPDKHDRSSELVSKPFPLKPSFGEAPAADKLSPAGHSRIDLSVRWVAKQSDGLYIQSKYGVLRLSPIRSNIIRVTFAKGTTIPGNAHPKIAVKRTERLWRYKDTPSGAELFTDDLYLYADKTTGAVSYMTRSKKLLLAERGRECRQLSMMQGKKQSGWLFLDWSRKEQLYSYDFSRKEWLNLNGTARYISSADDTDSLPLIFSDKGYAILLAADGPSICCNIPAYGSYLYAETMEQLDFYFIADRQQKTILHAYDYLRGKL